jgi:hypothetical protein
MSDKIYYVNLIKVICPDEPKKCLFSFVLNFIPLFSRDLSPACADAGQRLSLPLTLKQGVCYSCKKYSKRAIPDDQISRCQ